MKVEEFSVKCDKMMLFPSAHFREMIAGNFKDDIVRALLK